MNTDIDNALFRPLGEFFARDEPDFAIIEDLAKSHGASGTQNHPRYQGSSAGTAGYIHGLVFEIYVRWMLRQFEPAGRATFSSALISVTDRHADGILVKQNQRGTVDVVNAPGWQRVELDALYEYRDGASIVPVVFEAKAGSPTLRRVGTRLHLVRALYHVPSYCCTVQLARGFQKLGFHALQDKRQKLILTPNYPQFRRISARVIADMCREKVGP